MTIHIEVRCAVARVHVEALAQLLPELVALVGAGSLTSLSSIVIVEAADVQRVVSDAIRVVGPAAEYVPNPAYPPAGVAVPIEQNGRLTSLVVLAREVIELMALPAFHPAETVSVVLEELLHVSVYEAAWRRRGYVHYGARASSPCDADVFTLASRVSDEYVVNRRKGTLVSAHPIVDSPDGGLSSAQLRYGAPVVDVVSDGIAQLIAAISEGREHVRAMSHVWERVVSTLYRGVLEPLARQAAYDDVAPSGQPLRELRHVAFYREHVSTSWVTLHERMRQIFDTDLRDTEVVLPEMCSIIRGLLLALGVRYGRLADGSCWVRVD